MARKEAEPQIGQKINHRGPKPKCPYFEGEIERGLKCKHLETVTEMMKEANEKGRPFTLLPPRSIGLCQRPAISERRIWVKFPVSVDKSTGRYLRLNRHNFFGFEFYTKMRQENRPCREPSQKIFDNLNF